MLLVQFTVYFFSTVFFFLFEFCFLLKCFYTKCCKFDAKEFYLRYEFQLEVYQLIFCLMYGFFLMEKMGFVMSLEYLVVHHSDVEIKCGKKRINRRSVGTPQTSP